MPDRPSDGVEVVARELREMSIVPDETRLAEHKLDELADRLDAYRAAQESERERCPRDSDWCDGVICRERGIECPNAGPAQEPERLTREGVERLARVFDGDGAISSGEHVGEYPGDVLRRLADSEGEPDA